MVLDQVLCIHYLLRFCKDKKNKVRPLINSSKKVNMITLVYTFKLGVWVHHTKVGAYKIDDSILEILEILLASFQIKNKFEKTWFFQKTFLFDNISV